MQRRCSQKRQSATASRSWQIGIRRTKGHHGQRLAFSCLIGNAERPTEPDPEPALVAVADPLAPELVVETARPFPIVLVVTQEDVAGAGWAEGVGFWPWNQVDVP